jgi:uncharacterized protein
MFEPVEFFNFLKKPQYQNLERKNTSVLGTAIKIYLITFVLVGLVNLISITIFRVLLTLPTDETLEIPVSLKEHLLIYFIYAVIFAPFLEEVIFRLSLIFNPGNLALSISTFIALIIHKVFNMYFSIIVFLFFYFLINSLASTYRLNFISFWDKNYKYIFYLMPILFGLVHIGNFKFINVSQFLIAPVLIFPQLVVGFILSFTRLYYKSGFLICIIFHTLMNLISISVSMIPYWHQ